MKTGVTALFWVTCVQWESGFLLAMAVNGSRDPRADPTNGSHAQILAFLYHLEKRSTFSESLSCFNVFSFFLML